MIILVYKIEKYINQYTKEYYNTYKIQNNYKMEVEILNVRLPKKIVSWLDSLVEKGIYKSRSEAIRDFSREYLKQIQLEVRRVE